MKVKRFLVILLVLLCLFSVSAYAAGHVTNVNGINILAVTVGSHSGSIQDAADQYLIDSGYAGEDSILLYVDRNSHEYATTTSENAVSIFYDDVLYSIEDGLISYFRSGDFDGAESYFFDRCAYVIQHGGEAQVSPTAKIKQIAARIAASLGIGILAGGIPLHKSKAELTSVKKKASASDYESTPLSLTNRQDIFVNRNVTKVPIPRNDSRSGPGGGAQHYSSTHSYGGHSFGGHSGKW